MPELTQYLRLAENSDRALWHGVRQLCCQTGNDGAAIEPAQWEFFAQVWIAPYQNILPQWTYVATSDNVVVGYLTGCPDTAKFLRQKWLFCDLPLAVRLSAKIARLSPTEKRFLKRIAGLTRGPEQGFPATLRRSLTRAYPAHLHMNVDASRRRQGIGRHLIARYFADLGQARVAGVHLYCGSRPREFYRRMGFVVLGTSRYAGIDVYALGAALSDKTA